MKNAISNIFLKSDLLTTRATVGLSSLLFSMVSLFDFMFQHGAYDDLYWFIFSFFHASIVFYSLIKSKINTFTMIGEALFGFILWNWISISLLMWGANNAEAQFVPNGATLAPTFVIGMTTWWILSRYPTIKTKKRAIASWPKLAQDF